MIKIERVLGPLGGAFLGMGASQLVYRLGLSGSDRLYIFLFVLGIGLLPMSVYMSLVRRVAALEDASKKTPHAAHAAAPSAPAR